MQDSPKAERANAETAGRTLAAIMFTDMVGYSALTQMNESLALELLEQHHRLLRPVFPKFGGKEIKTIGDAFLVEFASALNAVRCAIEMQHALVTHNATTPAKKRIQIRIGIHVGDVVHQNEDVFGDAVNIASRIEPLAHPGGVCVSEDVARQIQNKIEEPIRRIGKSDLKNIALPVEVYEVALLWMEKEDVVGHPSPHPPPIARPVLAGSWRGAMVWSLSGLALLVIASIATWYVRPTASKPVMRLNVNVAPAERLTGLT